MRQLRNQANIKQRFRWPLAKEEACKLLYVAYQNEVMKRCMTMQNTEDLIDNIKRVADALTAKEPKNGIMLAGCPGNGKTTMLYAIRNATNLLVDHGYFSDYDDKENHVGIWVADARDIVRGAQEKDVDRLNNKIPNYQSLKNYNMIGIEDMGKEPSEVLAYGNVMNPIVELIEHRYERQLYTAITTNLSLEQIREKYGARVYDRFAETMALIVFTRDEKNSYRRF